MDAKAYRKAIEDYHLYARENAGNELTHWGISGMKWGRRRWQNEDGSLTEAGRIHYGVGDARKEAKNKAAIANIKNKQTMKQKERLAKIERRNELTAAKADAIRIKAQQEAQIKEAEAETEQRKISAKVDKQAEKNRHAEEGLGRKLLIGAGIVAGAAFLIKLKNSSVSEIASESTGSAKDGVKASRAKTAKKVVDKLKNTPVSEVTNAINGGSEKEVSLFNHLKNRLYSGAVNADDGGRKIGLWHNDEEEKTGFKVRRIPR